MSVLLLGHFEVHLLISSSQDDNYLYDYCMRSSGQMYGHMLRRNVFQLRRLLHHPLQTFVITKGL